MSSLRPTIRDDDGKPLGLAFTNPFEQLGRPTERGRRMREAGQRLQHLPTRREWGRMALNMAPGFPVMLAGALAPAPLPRLGIPFWAMFLVAIPLGTIPAAVSVLTMRLAMRER